LDPAGGGKGRVETFDVPDLQYQIPGAGGANQRVRFGHAGRHRLLDQQMHASLGQLHADPIMIACWRRDDCGVNASQQGAVILARFHGEFVGDPLTGGWRGIADAHQVDVIDRPQQTGVNRS
jgi:hypothetical protein